MSSFERVVPVCIVVVVFLSRGWSLFSGDAPFFKSSFEHATWLATLPGSAVVALLDRVGAGESLLLWGLGLLIWAAVAYLQFAALASIPRVVGRHPLASKLLTAGSAIGVIAAGLWGLSRIPANPEEEATSFFLAVPLWFACASAVVLVLSLSGRAQRSGV